MINTCTRQCMLNDFGYIHRMMKLLGRCLVTLMATWFWHATCQEAPAIPQCTLKFDERKDYYNMFEMNKQPLETSFW